MPEITGLEKIFSSDPSKRFGKPCEYGQRMYAFAEYGDEPIIVQDVDGKDIELSGIYRRDNVTGKLKYYREPYYIPLNPRTGPQQAQRAKLADGVVAWQALTNDEKKLYRESAYSKHMSGYNLFLREYLLSH